ncbi:MAG: hypothetical protein DRQ78_08980 [Epsilonproteobacteria bacterium]|nr:MAG: hypothetical protein DRQ78_08980 [Campylobacterota bacterium]
MKSFKELLSEKKDHLIKKNKNLSDEEKDILIAHFKKYPHLENQINWNNKKLTFDDFSGVLLSTSKRQKKKALKDKGIGGLKEGEDYINIRLRTKGYLAYAPLNYEASKSIATKHIGQCEGKWCVAYQKSRSYWQHYVYQDWNKNGSSIFVYIIGDGTKWAMDIHKNTFDLWDVADEKIMNDGKVIDDGYHMDSDGNMVSNLPDEAVLKEIMTKKRLFDDIKQYKVDKKIDFIEKAVTKDADYGSKLVGMAIPGTKIIQSDDVWFTGEWIKGTWHSGSFKGYKSIWHNGIWLGGTFEFGTWKNGTWKYGEWNPKRYNIIWENGTWEGGYWYGGIWENGIWEGGWFGGGTWKNGDWYDGRWNFGVWEYGEWSDGIFEDGEWKDGIWHGGKFTGGKWQNGRWEDGEFGGSKSVNKPVWKDGVFHGGIFKNAIWKGGIWRGGRWFNSEWLGGYDKKGRYHEEGDSPDKWDHGSIELLKKKRIKS